MELKRWKISGFFIVVNIEVLSIVVVDIFIVYYVVFVFDFFKGICLMSILIGYWKNLMMDGKLCIFEKLYVVFGIFGMNDMFCVKFL